MKRLAIFLPIKSWDTERSLEGPNLEINLTPRFSDKRKYDECVTKYT